MKELLKISAGKTGFSSYRVTVCWECPAGELWVIGSEMETTNKSEEEIVAIHYYLQDHVIEVALNSIAEFVNKAVGWAGVQ